MISYCQKNLPKRKSEDRVEDTRATQHIGVLE